MSGNYRYVTPPAVAIVDGHEKNKLTFFNPTVGTNFVCHKMRTFCTENATFLSVLIAGSVLHYINACHNPKQLFKINNKKLPEVCGG